MYSVKIYGAGSIGNHLAHACRSRGWRVMMCDTDPLALERTRDDIYPSRYGRWDPEIRLSGPDAVRDEAADVVIIGTPPDSHMALAAEVLENRPPRVLLVEKPMCPPSLEGVQKVVDLQKATGTFVAIGYNHTLTENTRRAALVLKEKGIGDPVTISAWFREHWGGIFAAHPWLKGPGDTYLGFSGRGGGAGGEHSHAINIWQHFSHLVGAGRIVEVSATMDMVTGEAVAYDRVCLMSVRTETGLVGHIAQDVVTDPPQKAARIQGSRGFLEWIVNLDGDHDAVRYRDADGREGEEIIHKTRPDDFKGEIDLVEEILNGADPSEAPISLERGLETMRVIAAAHLSHRKGRRVRIHYDRGLGTGFLE